MTPKSAQSTTHCSHSAIVPKAFCLWHPSLPLNSSTSLSTQNTHCIPVTTVILEHILLLCTNTSLFFPHRWALTQHFPSHSWLQDTSAIYLPCPCRAPAPFLQPLQQSMLLTTPNLNSFCPLSTPPHSPNNPLSDHHGPVFQHGPVHVAKTQIIPSLYQYMCWKRPTVTTWCIYSTCICAYRTGGCHTANSLSQRN